MMPIIKSAIKKLRKDKTRTVHNKLIESNLKRLAKDMRQNPSAKLLSQVSSALDKAAKVNLIHGNKASRLKSRLSKLIASGVKPQVTKRSKPAKRVAKKTSKK